MKTFDYVIVGAGSAGCTLAARLSENENTSVLLLEAGGWDRDPLIRFPLGFAKIWAERRHDWMYFTEPTAQQPRAGYSRGKVIGGTSSINAMLYVRGNRGDYDRWASTGLDRLSYRNVLPYFLKQEDWAGGASAYHGTRGPLKTRFSNFSDPVVDAYFEAADSLGLPLTEDYNGLEQEGFGRMQSTMDGGWRCSAADAYLRPALKRPNLTVRVRALAHRIILDKGRAVGVEYSVQGSQPVVVHADREVILSGGTVNSPQLLMLSGIGDPEVLKSAGVETQVDIRGVGRNLRDHIFVGAEYSRKTPGPLQQLMRFDRLATELVRALLTGKGIFTDLPSGWTAFVKARHDAAIPDAQLVFRAGPPDAAPYWPLLQRGFIDGFGCSAVLLRPERTGSVMIKSPDPTVAPRITRVPVETEQDFSTLRNALRMIQRLGRTAALAPFVDRELSPDFLSLPDADVDAHIRDNAHTFNHPAGTCRMGQSVAQGAVVDQDFRVFGVERLRVVDASVMPDQIGGNLNGPIIMLAELASDLIRGRKLLAPAFV